MSAPEWQLILALIAVMVTAPVVIQHSARSLLGGACMALSPNACRGRARPELTGPSCYPVLAWTTYTARKSLVRSKERTLWRL